MNKKVFAKVFFFSLSVLMCACGRGKTAFTRQNAPHHFVELKALERLIETQPSAALDSVAWLKDQEAHTPFTELDACELRLREVQAQYKNRSLSTASPDLSPVLAFYDSLAVFYPTDADLQFLRANAYYYKGAECAFASEDVMALTHYLKALQVMSLRDDWSGNPYAKRFIALTFTRLSEILYRYGLQDEAFESCRKASSYYESEADLAAIMRFEAAIYQSQKDYDKALARFQESTEMVPMDDGQVQLSVGAKLIELQQYDSAVPHLETAFDSGDRFARVEASAKLAAIYRDKGRADEELRYTRFYVENSMSETRLASRKLEIEYLYEDFNRPKEQVASSKEPQASSPLWILMVLLAVIVFLAYIIVRNRKRISHIENKISTIEQRYGQGIADSDVEIEQVSQQLNNTHERPENTNKIDFDMAWQSYMESPMALKIKNSLDGKDIMIKNVGVFPKLKLKEMDYMGLVQAANRSFPDFSSRFLKDHPDLNVADVRHSCLALLGLNDAEIAVLEGISYSGTNRRTNKVLAALNEGDNLELALLTYIKNRF
ncbi:MAG: tetratricopeptide repeat protein [Bacteroidales bacterium]|nr:tetratricopeptide repeat protein [Bacteroidales bacterium]